MLLTSKASSRRPVLVRLTHREVDLENLGQLVLRYHQIHPKTWGDAIFFVDSRGNPIKKEQVRTSMRALLGSLGIKPHSFRIGQVTDLYKRGNTVEFVMAEGRWKSGVVRTYLR